MKSEELNKRIAKLCDNDEDAVYEAFPNSGKCIPYIGWFWRTVNFDADSCLIGRFPDGESWDTAPGYNGFMENNKWGYGYVLAEGDVWENIKALLVTAVLDPTYENLKAANEAIQALTDLVIPHEEW